MVEILERGVNPEDEPIVTRCRKCRTKFSFLPREAKRHFNQRDGDFYSLPCPNNCGYLVSTRII